MRAVCCAIVCGLVAAAGCGGAGRTQSQDAGGGADPLTCAVTPPATCPNPAPHYADVQPIIQQSCAGPCHSGTDPNGPWPLTSYEHVADWADVILPDLIDCTMPPADGGVSLAPEDRLAILTWIRCGFPE